MNSKRLLTIPEFCERFSVGRTTVFAELKAHRLKAVRVGKKVLISTEAAEEWLSALPSARRAA